VRATRPSSSATPRRTTSSYAKRTLRTLAQMPSATSPSGLACSALRRSNSTGGSVA